MAIDTLGAALFGDRRDAGRQLGAAMKELALDNPLVLALPRGGVPVGLEVARALGAPLDLMLVRKIGAPGYPELAIGAVADGPQPSTMLNDEIIATVSASPSYIEAESRRQIDDLARRRQVYRGDRPAAEIAGRTVILVDDGIATGATIKAALLAVRPVARAVVIAVPVGPEDAVAEIRGLADVVVCLSTPQSFRAVGLYYTNFEQTTDDEVVRLLAEMRPG